MKKSTYFFSFMAVLFSSVMRSGYFYSCLALLFTNLLMAQMQVTGQVADEDGNLIPGVTILISGTDQGTTTDFDGNFSLNVAADAVLEISSIGFNPQTVAVNNQPSLLIVLMESLSELDEVIVTGYGVQTRGSISGSVASVNVSDAIKVPVANAAEALQGYYTQEDYQEIVAYAAAHFITVVPEFDLPGHTNAALAAYPELNCDGAAPPLYTGTEVGFSSLCVRKEITFRFIDEVIEEIAAITPGPYIHIGGDESHSTKKKDYNVFIDRTQAIVAKHGKFTLGWDEIQSTTLLPETVAQYWRSAENAKNTIAKGNKLLLSPASRAYLDMKYNDSTALGLQWAGKISVEHGYSWDPAALEEEIKEEHILGIEAPLWSETIEDFDDLAYLAFPRLLGYAEIGWTAQAQRHWEEYKNRLAAHGALLKAKEVNFYPSPMVEWKD